jgi:hypothetical protein
MKMKYQNALHGTAIPKSQPIQKQGRRNGSTVFRIHIPKAIFCSDGELSCEGLCQ